MSVSLPTPPGPESTMRSPCRSVKVPTQRTQASEEIRWWRRFEAQLLGGDGVAQAQAPRVQHRARRIARTSPPILLITRDRMTQGGQVDAYLMRAPGVEFHFQQCVFPQALHHRITRPGSTSRDDDRHALSVPRVASDIAFQHACLMLHHAVRDRKIGARK